MTVMGSAGRPSIAGGIPPSAPRGPGQPEREMEKAVKKRTKTGCQTCRTRRIKCDEGKPECNNCLKSKRVCGGYGTRTTIRDGMASEMKKSRRFAPYGDRAQIKTYKNIVPAPPKGVMDARPPEITQNIVIGPKRKREEEVQVSQYGERPETTKEQPQPRPPSPYRYSATPRIPISSLLTIDQATIAAFVQQQSLNTFVPNYFQCSPLMDPILFDAFKHYIDVVAPTMSLIESSPPNPTILNYHVIPNMKACNLFTYQLPVMAVSGNCAIMEAILAISFLHISHVSRSSKQQAFLHYQLAIKRLRIESSKANAAQDLGLLSATLLLAWYELTTGDHSKWVSHMSGAKAVLIEFGSSRWRVTPESPVTRGDVKLDPYLYDIQDPTYSTANQPLESMRAVTDQLQISTGRVLLHELFYLYAKMDVIQSLVRGSPPLSLDLSEWRYPLRGPATKLIGLHDALLQLMARLAQFIATDRERKSSQHQGPSMSLPSIPTALHTPNASPQSTQSSTSPPTSTPWSCSSSRSSQADPNPLSDLVKQATTDWEMLSNDFRTWKQAFDNLKKVHEEPNMPTPFGTSLIYSDIRIAAAEMLYLAAQIHLNRAHPSTPVFPAAAIGVTAAQNGPLVAEIMRIQEGLWDVKNFGHVGESEDGRLVGGDGRTVDHVVSALSNSAWPMLVAGMQVRDEGQRKWIKKRLCDIYEISGFATAIRVRKGLEIGWGQRARGEPAGYEDFDSDEETGLPLFLGQQKEQARELTQRRQVVSDTRESRFILVKEGEGYLGDFYEESLVPVTGLMYDYGALGPWKGLVNN